MELNAIKDTQAQILERMERGANNAPMADAPMADLNKCGTMVEFDEEERRLEENGYKRSKVHIYFIFSEEKFCEFWNLLQSLCCEYFQNFNAGKSLTKVFKLSQILIYLHHKFCQ